jgi:hypothetical protein
MMVWLLSFVRGSFSAVFRIAFAIDLIVTLIRVFIASLTAVQWSQLLGRGLEPMGWAGQAFSPGPRYKPMWLAPNTNLV